MRFFVVLVLLGLVTPLYTYTRAHLHTEHVSAATGINRQISFQGKLVNPDGTNVTDGSYSIVFSIYTVASAGTNIWTETQSVTLSNGIFQVNLGSVTALPGSVDFNTDNIYLGIKVGADAEMTPRVQFTAVPQAFNAEKLGGLDKTGFIQNSITQQASSNFNISGAGVVGTTLTTPTLQSAAATALTITGNAASTWGTTAGDLTLKSGGSIILNDQTDIGSATTGIRVATTGSILDIDGDLILNDQVQLGGATGLQVTTTGIITDIDGASVQVGENLSVTAGGATIVGNSTIATTAGNTLGLGNSTGILTVTGSATSTFNINGVIVDATEFNLLNGKDTALVDTTDAVNTAITGVGTIGTGVWQGTAVAAQYGGTGQSTYAVGDMLYASAATTLSKLVDVATGNALLSGGVGVAPSYGKIGLTTHISGTLGLTNGGTNSTSYTTNGVIYSNGTSLISTAASTLAGQCLLTSGVGTAPIWATCTAASLQSSYNISTGGTTPEIKLDSTRGAVDIQDADTTINGNLLAVRGSNGAGLGAALFTVNSTGQVSLQNSTNSTSAFTVKNVASSTIFTVDTQNSRIGVGTATPTATMEVKNTDTQPQLKLSNPNGGYLDFVVSNNGQAALNTDQSLLQFKSIDSSTSFATRPAWNNAAPTSGDTYAAPAVTDLDGDGDSDMLVGFNSTAQTLGAAPAGYAASLPCTGARGNNAAFGDFTGDGIPDVLCGTNDANVTNTIIYRTNTGTTASPTWSGSSSFAIEANSAKADFFALADVSGDGKLDLVYTTSGFFSGVSVRLNTGTVNSPVWTSAATTYTLPSSDIPYMQLAVTDVTGDGLKDIVYGRGATGGLFYVPNTGTSSVPVWTSAKTTIAATGNFLSPTFVDYNSDGLQDLAVGKQSGASTTTVIEMYQNTGTASSPAWTRNSAWDLSITGSQANLSTSPALLVVPTAYGNRTLTTLYGSALSPYTAYNSATSVIQGIAGTPTFGSVLAYQNTGSDINPIWTRQVTWDPSIGSVYFPVPAIADLNNDSKQDVLVGNETGVSVAYQNTGTVNVPAWTAAPSWNLPDVGNDAAPTLIDLNGDAKFDALIGERAGASYAYQNTGTVSSPTWSRASAWDAPDVGSNAAPALANLDSDSDLDLLIGAADGNTYAYKNTGSVTSPNWVSYGTWQGIDVGTYAVPAFVDFGTDGDRDLLIGDSTGTITAQENVGSGDVVPVITATTDGNLKVGNITGEGITYSRVQDPASTGYFNNQPDQEYETDATINTSYTQNKPVINTADFNNDGFGDLVVIYGTTVAVRLNSGGNGYFAQVTYATNASNNAVLTGDFNGDGKQDVFTFSTSGSTPAFLYGNGDGTLQAAVSATGAPSGSNLQMMAADLNNDGKTDLAVKETTGSTSYFYIKGAGNAFNAPSSGNTSTLGSFTLGDFNGDGFKDMITAGSGLAYINLNNGSGAIGAPTTTTATNMGYELQSGDYNNDGNLDVGYIQSGTQFIYLPGTGSGTFGAATNNGTSTSQLTILKAADINQDGKTDMLTFANSGTGVLTILKNSGSGLVNENNTYSISVNALAITDVNHDTYPDIVSVQSGHIVVFINRTPQTTVAESSVGQVSIKTNSAAVGGLFIQGSVGQTASLFAILDSSGNGLMSVDASGNLRVKGTIRGGYGSPDYAENITVSDPSIGAADVVALDPARSESVVKSTVPYSPQVIGVISTSPGFVTNADKPDIDDASQRPLALSGRVPVKVTDENGPVVAGDYLTSSSTPGYAMKATHAGTVIGRAMGNFDGSEESTACGAFKCGKVLMFIDNSYYDPADGNNIQGADMNLAGDLQIAGNAEINGSLNVSGAANITSLTVTGDAEVQGNLVVVGDASVQNITVNGHIITAGNAPVVATGVGAGVEDMINSIAAPIVAIEGNDTSGTITLTVGENTTADELAQITFSQAFGGKPRVVLTPGNRDAVKLNAYYDASNASVTGFRIMSDVAPEAGKTYVFTYYIVE
jgi:hypothetical protein